MARAVAAGDRVLRFRPDRSHWWSTGVDQLDGTVCGAVRIRPGLVGLDIDDTADAPPYRRLLAAIRAAGLPYVEVASGGDGRRHLWLAVGDLDADTDEALRERIAAALPGERQPLRNGGAPLRPPLSPHYSGAPSTLLDPPDPADALAVLEGPGDPDAARRLLADLPATDRPATSGRRSGRRSGPLTETTEKLLRHGADPGAYRGRSEEAFALAVGLTNGGWSVEAVAAALETSPAGEHVRTYPDGRPKRDPAGLARRQAEKAARWVAEHPPRRDATEERERIEELRAGALAVQWPTGLGARPATIVRVHLALLDIADDAGRLTFQASHRQIAERAGVGRGSACRALAVLVDLGVVVREHRGRITEEEASGSTWALEHSAERIGTIDLPPFLSRRTIVPMTSTQAGQRVEAGHDAWRHGGLGGSALRVALLLADGEVRPAGAVGEQLGVSARWARVLLSRLEDAGLACSGPGGWTLTGADGWVAALDRVAEAAGVAGAGRRQQVRHALEREEWRKERARVAKESTDGSVEDDSVEDGIEDAVVQDDGTDNGVEDGPVRLKLSRAAGWQLPAGARSVARPHRFGNPWPVTADRPAAAAVDLYRAWLDGTVSAPPGWAHDRGDVLDALPTLTGRDLACWCPLDQPCHADVLLEIANNSTDNSVDGKEKNSDTTRSGSVREVVRGGPRGPRRGSGRDRVHTGGGYAPAAVG